MRREGSKKSIISNHTIRKHFKEIFTKIKNGKYKSKFRKQYDFWPFKNRNEWDKYKKIYCGNFCQSMIEVYTFLKKKSNDNFESSFLPVTPNYSKKLFYSVGPSDKYDANSFYTNDKKEFRTYKSKKSLKKQKGINKSYLKRNYLFI